MAGTRGDMARSKAVAAKKPKRPRSAMASAGPRWRADVEGAVTHLVQGWQNVRPGRMFGFPAFYVGRSLFACIYGSGVGLKLPERTAQQMKTVPDVAPFRPYGKPEMREWIFIHHAQVKDYQADEALFREAVAHAASSPKNRGAAKPGAR